MPAVPIWCQTHYANVYVHNLRRSPKWTEQEIEFFRDRHVCPRCQREELAEIGQELEPQPSASEAKAVKALQQARATIEAREQEIQRLKCKLRQIVQTRPEFDLRKFVRLIGTQNRLLDLIQKVRAPVEQMRLRPLGRKFCDGLSMEMEFVTPHARKIAEERLRNDAAVKNVYWQDVGTTRRAWITLRPESFFIALGSCCVGPRLARDLTRRGLIRPGGIKIRKTDVTQDFRGSFMCEKEERLEIRLFVQQMLEALPGAQKRALGLHQRLVVRINSNSLSSCLYLEVKTIDRADTVTDVCQVKVYCKTIELMSRTDSFTQVGGRFQELFNSDLGKNKPLELALKKAQETGVTRIELSFYKLNLVKTPNLRVAAILINKVRRVLDADQVRQRVIWKVPVTAVLNSLASLDENTLICHQKKAILILAQCEKSQIFVGTSKQCSNHAELQEFINRSASAKCMIRVYVAPEEKQHCVVRKIGHFIPPNVNCQPSQHEAIRRQVQFIGFTNDDLVGAISGMNNIRRFSNPDNDKKKKNDDPIVVKV